MQSRFVSTLIATTALIAAVSLTSTAWSQTDVLTVEGTRAAAETEHDKHVFVNNATAGAEEAPATVEANGQSDALTDGLMLIRAMATPEAEEAAAGGADGGIWRAPNAAEASSADQVSNGSADDPHTDGLLVIRHLFGAEPPPATPTDVTPAPAEGRTDYLLELDGVPGESSQEANGAQAGGEVDSGQEGQAIGLLLPAVQKVRPAADRVERAGTGTLTLSGSSQPAAPNDPETPVCGVCGADNQAQQTSAAQQEPQRRRPNFSVSFGGVTVGTGGVNVAVGDVNGDGRGRARTGRSSTPQRARPAPSRGR